MAIRLTNLGKSLEFISKSLGTRSTIFEKFFNTYGEAMCNLGYDEC